MEFGYTYEPNDISSDKFLSEVPLALMKENIVSQFDEPLEYRKKDFIVTFITMYKFSEDNVNVYEDEEADNITELRDNFYEFMQELFNLYLGIGFTEFDDLSKEEQDDLIHYTYRFFLINIKKNFVCYILNQIELNHDDYLNQDVDQKKDVTTLSFKKEITDPADVYVLSNLSDVIDEILEHDVDVDEFFKYCDTEESSLETRFVKEKFDNFIITGNFFQKYVEMINYDFNSEIESKVRNKILKKYKKK